MSWSLSPSVRRTRSCCLTVATEARKQLAKGTTYPPAHIHTQRGGHRGHFTLLGSLTPSTTSHNHHNHHNDSRNGVPRCRRSLRRFFDHNLALPFDMVLTMVLNYCTLHPACSAPRHTVHSHQPCPRTVALHVCTMQVLLIHTVLLAYASDKTTEGIAPYIALFLIIYVVEIGLRLYAEGCADLWVFRRLGRIQDDTQGPLFMAAALRCDLIIVVLTVAGYTASRVAQVASCCRCCVCHTVTKLVCACAVLCLFLCGCVWLCAVAVCRGCGCACCVCACACAVGCTTTGYTRAANQ